MYKVKYFSFFGLFFLLLSKQLFPQIVIRGTVTDNGAKYLGSGAEPVEGCLVTITNQENPNCSFSCYTDERGFYLIEIIQTTVNDNPLVYPYTFGLLQNYPNPFNPSTVIGYELLKPSHISIEIYNILGQKVKTLVNGFQNSSDQVIWNGTNNMGRRVPAGLYIYSLKAEGKIESRKMLLINGNQGSMYTASSSYRGELISKQVLHKQLSNQYVLTVTRNNIAHYEQLGIEITDSITIDVMVTRTVTDIDCNVYQTVKIGDQWWMAENLKVTHYRNGYDILNVTSDSAWSNLSSGAYCVYANNEIYKDSYGYLYNWYAVNDSNNIAPEGWHVPTDDEWKQLEMYLGMSRSEADGTGFRGIDEGGKIKEAGTTHWNSPNSGATNESGLSTLPGGACCDYDGICRYMGRYGVYWSSTESRSITAWDRSLSYTSSDIYRISNTKRSGYSVRCVKN